MSDKQMAVQHVHSHLEVSCVAAAQAEASLERVGSVSY